MNVEVLPLTTMNLLQSVHSESQEQDAADYTKDTSCESLEVGLEELSLVSSEDVSETVSNTDTEDNSTGESQPVDGLDGTSEFGNTEFEDLMLKEGPEQILQLMLIGASHHHLYMLDVATGEDPPEESAPAGESIATQDEPVQQKDMPTAIKRKRPQYSDKQQQLELVFATQELSKLRDPDLSPTGSDNEDECENLMLCVEIMRFSTSVWRHSGFIAMGWLSA
ncbi:unnamed protein product [Sphagnum tenellum]